MNQRNLVVAFIMLSWLSSAYADTGLARHKKLYAVPTPGKITIDGKLDDWDLSGQILMYVVSETADMQSAKFALMYDKDALYVSGVVRDSTPMMNRHDPKVDGDWGWNADSCQFRLALDPTMEYPLPYGVFNPATAGIPNLVHLTLWNYTDRHEPCLQMRSTMKYNVPRPEWNPFGVVPQNLFEAKYRAMDDGRGYTLEYRIPWSTLGAKAPLKAGDLVGGTVQFNWGKADGLATNGGWAYDVMSGPGFPYQSATCWGKMIFSDKGNLLKEIVEEGLPPEKPLPLKFTYDLPEDSQVTVELFDTNNLVRRILVAQGDRRAGQNIELWDGLEDQGQPLPAGEYTWKGLYHQPITQKFLFSPHNSGQPPYVTDDGKGAWGADHGTPQDACAFNGGVLLSWQGAEAGWGIIRTDFEGHKQWGTKSDAKLIATDGKRFFTYGPPFDPQNVQPATGIKVFDVADGRPLNFGNGHPELAAPPGGDKISDRATGLAYHDGVVYVAYGARNLIAKFDAQSGDFKSTLDMPAPGRMAVTPDGKLCVISGNSLQLANHKITEHLDSPTGLAVGPDGTIYVANAGKLQNVSVFDSAGKYLRSIGKMGGRPAVGRYDPNGVLEPGGIALDAKGQLWVAETLDYPKRISVWDAKTGAFRKEFFGGCSYAGFAWLDPRKPDEIYCHNVIWKVDWKNNTCSPFSTIWRQTDPNMMVAPDPAGSAMVRFFTAKNGHQFCFGYGDNAVESMVLMRVGDVYKPICAFIDARFRKTRPVAFALLQDEKKYPNAQYFWQDANDDQIIQENELTNVAELKNPDYLVFRTVADDLTGWMYRGYLMRPVRFEKDGRPVYDLKKLEKSFLAGTPHGENSYIWPDPDDGGVYTLALDQTPSLGKWSADGKLLWGYPQLKSWPVTLGYPMIAPGRLWGLTTPLGVSGEFTGNACYFGPYHLFTRDGLYMAMLMRDGRDGKGLGPDITLSETFTGQIVKPDGMDRYFLLAGAGDARVTEIFGLNTLKRMPGGKVVLTEADVKLARDAQTEYASKLANSQRLSIARGRKGLDSAASIQRAYDNARAFTVRTSYDEQNVYVLYEVTAPFELTSEHSDPHLLFKGGNCLDIQLATDSAADPARKTPAPGDVRLLVTRKAGPSTGSGTAVKPFAVLFRPKVKGFQGQPIVLTSPTGTESFDAIENVNVGLEYTKTPAGFRAVVTVPLSLLGWKPQPGQAMKLDFGYLYGNATGTQTALRSYWRNNSFSAGVLGDVPNESRLEPKEWGTATVE